MFKVVDWYQRKRYIHEFELLNEALGYFNNAEDSFTECILDENNIIIDDGMKNVIGSKTNRVGELYLFN